MRVARFHRRHAPSASRDAEQRRGLALVIVLLVLLALLVLCTPFLLSARNADRSSSELADRAATRLGLESAARHARAQLGKSHPSSDPTPDSDALDEIHVDNAFDPAFLDPNDPRALMWDLESDDVAGRIDLDSASPLVVANLLNMATRFTRAITVEDKEFPIASRAAFEPAGYAWAGGELVHYKKIEDDSLRELERGLLATLDAQESRGGPRPAVIHDPGAPVLDQRAFAPALWRIAAGNGDVRRLESIGELRETQRFSIAHAAALEADQPIAEDWLAPLYRHGSAHGGVRAGRVWQHAARIAVDVAGGEDGLLRVDHLRWFNVGSTVQIRDGHSSEVALVTEITRAGEVVLDRILVNDYTAYRAEVRVLSRRPVNLNTASFEVLEALFANLQIAGRNSRITRDEAFEIARLVIESRPFTGLEDFLRRLVLPAAGLEKLPTDADVRPDMLQNPAGFLDPLDALALYQNGLNANDSSLAFSTMPYCFTTRDVYAFELRSTLNAPSGVERFSAVRNQVEVVCPQRELLALWTRQEDFEEALRLDREAPWWATAPNATSRWDRGSVPPSRVWAQMGTLAGEPFLPGLSDPALVPSPEVAVEHVFGSRDANGWIQLWPSRTDEIGRRVGHVLHFDHETRDLEGRYLPDEVVALGTDDKKVLWTETAKNVVLLRPLALSMWVKPKEIADATLFDVGGSSLDSDRVSLLFEGPDLVLRVLDAPGDHPDTTETEFGEVRFALAAGQDPGMPADVWSHVAFDVRGTRPDQMNMLVNGLAHGVRTPGLTRLGGDLNPGDAVIPVESIEGFPPHGVVRIGDELIEYELSGQNLLALPKTVGPLAGIGGRLAREAFSGTPPARGPAKGTAANPQGSNPAGSAAATVHPRGTTVAFYGYSMALQSNAPSGQAALPSDLGPFAVGVVESAFKGSGTSTVPSQEPITLIGVNVSVGTGIDGAGSQVTALQLTTPEPAPMTVEKLMQAFSPTGGYAVMMQLGFSSLSVASIPPQTTSDIRTVGGSYIFGVEIFYYTGWTGDRLLLDPNRRGDNLGFRNTGLGIGQRHAFVVKWAPGLTIGGVDPNTSVEQRVFVFPISVAAPGAASLAGFLPPTAGYSEFAQLTHLDAGELTEWVRYDEIASDHLVRNAQAALQAAFLAATHNTIGSTGSADLIPPAGPNAPHAPSLPAPAPAVIAPAEPAAQASAYAKENVGEPDPAEGALTKAVREAFQFRGVMGTYSHAQPRGTILLPVFRVSLGDDSLDSGRPGKMDPVFLIDANPTDVGFPGRVHHVYYPVDHLVSTWVQSPGGPTVASGTTGTVVFDASEIHLDAAYVALQEKLPVPVAAGTITTGAAQQDVDTRRIARITKHPSGERPRIVDRLTVGGGFQSGTSGIVPSLVADEVVFATAELGMQAPAVVDREALRGGSLVLQSDCSDTETTLHALPLTLRVALGKFSTTHEFLGEIAESGLLRIGEEILAYQRRDPSSGDIFVAEQGRGLLGTRAQPHYAGESVQYLEDFKVGVLNAGIGADDSRLPLLKVDGFPIEGTVLLDREIVHHTRVRTGALEMPRASSVPGAMDEKGEALFRGRYGTEAAAHPAGVAVIVFPFRYWDRWADRADAPELAYFSLVAEQPSAFWSSCFFEKTDGSASTIAVLAKTDARVPWDADPEREPRLRLLQQGNVEEKPVPLGQISDSIEWRIFVRYAYGAFDIDTGLNHGWKETPRLDHLGAFYYAPGRVLSSVDR